MPIRDSLNAKRMKGQIAMGHRVGFLDEKSYLVNELKAGRKSVRAAINANRTMIKSKFRNDPSTIPRLRKELGTLLKAQKERKLSEFELRQLNTLKTVIQDEIKARNKPVKLP